MKKQYDVEEVAEIAKSKIMFLFQESDMLALCREWLILLTAVKRIESESRDT